MDQNTETSLPSAFKEVKRTEQAYKMTQGEIPWLEHETEMIHLAKVTLSGSENTSFFFGNMLRTKPIIDAANQLDEHRTRIANNILYAHLPEFLRGQFNNITKMDHVRTNRPVYYIGNKSGQRVYFMRFDNLDSIPVIIRIAVCDKARQDKVISVIGYKSQKYIKQSGKL